jgi:hypothetical protein
MSTRLSKDDAPLAFPPRHALTIKILEQGNGIFARDSREVFELADVYCAVGTLVCLGPQFLRQILKGGAMKVHISMNLYQRAGLDQQMENLSGMLLGCFQSGLGKSFSDRGRRHTGVPKRSFEQVALADIVI